MNSEKVNKISKQNVERNEWNLFSMNTSRSVNI